MANGFTKDIGGGVVTATAPGLANLVQSRLGGGSGALNQLRALRLGQQIETGGIEQQIQEIKLKRQQSGQISEQFGQLSDAFEADFEQGKFLLGSSIKGATATQNKDQTVTITIPNERTGAVQNFTIDPKKVADPQKRQGLETGLRKEFVSGNKQFGTQAQFFRSMKELSTQGTAQADIGIVFSFMKLLDPTSVVREGEQATARNSPGVPERVRNLWNRALTQDAPLFGPKGSRTREKFVQAGEVLFENAKSDVLAQAQALSGIATRNRLNPQNVIIPIGGIDFFKEIREASGAQETGQGDGLDGLSIKQLQEIDKQEGGQ